MTQAQTNTVTTSRTDVEVNVADIDSIATSPDVTLVQASSIKGAMKVNSASSRDLWMVPRANIKIIPGFNVRLKNDAYHAHIRFLADSIKENGFKPEHPLAGYVANENGASVIYVFDGHCRLAGSDLAISEGAQIESLPVVVSSKAANIDDLTCNLVSSATGKALDPIEKAAVCKRLLGYGWNEDQIAKRLSFTKTYVRELLRLIGSPPDIRRMIADGEISSTTALQMLTEHGSKAPEKIREGLAKAKAEGKNRVTSRHMADPTAKFAKKHAIAFRDLTLTVKGDPGYAGLSEETRKTIEELLGAHEKAEQKAREKAQKSSGENNDLGSDKAPDGSAC